MNTTRDGSMQLENLEERRRMFAGLKMMKVTKKLWNLEKEVKVWNYIDKAEKDDRKINFEDQLCR